MQIASKHSTSACFRIHGARSKFLSTNAVLCSRKVPGRYGKAISIEPAYLSTGQDGNSCRFEGLMPSCAVTTQVGTSIEVGTCRRKCIHC